MTDTDEAATYRRAIHTLLERRQKLDAAIEAMRQLIDADEFTGGRDDDCARPLAALSLKEALVVLLDRHERPLTNHELSKLLEEGGYDLSGPAPQVLLSQTLRRLQDAGRVRRVERGFWQSVPEASTVRGRASGGLR